MSLSGGDALVRALEAEGIDTVFGTVGHGNLAFVDALGRSGIRYVSVFHEQVAAHAADAYFRVSGRMAAVTTTVGPGFTNLATGLGDALLDSSAMLVIAGGIPTGYRGKEALQELSLHVDDSQPELYRNLAKRVTRVERAQDLGHELHRAVVRARSGNPGPVILHVPLDLFSAPVEAAAGPPAPYEPGRPGPDPDAVRRAADLLRAAERPVLFCGGGALISEAGDVVRRLAERHGIPVATTMSGQGIVPETHPLAVGFTGVVGTRPGNEAVKRADLLIAVGTRFPEMDASSWRAGFFAEIPPARLIHVDLDPNQIGKLYPADAGLVGDARRSLEELLAALGETAPERAAWREEVAALRSDWAAEVADLRASDAFPYEPAALLTELRSLLPDETVLVSGVGIRHAVGQHFPFAGPRTQVVASGFGTMGQEVAAPLGARLARPEVPVVALVGDGAVLACLAALPSAVANGIDGVWIVLANRGYASIAVYQAKHFAGRFTGTYLEDAAGGDYEVDFAGLARSFGAAAHTVDAPGDLAGAVRAALAEPGPSVVVVPVTPRPSVRGSGQWDVNDILALTPEGEVSVAGGRA